MFHGDFNNTGTIVKFIFRRERFISAMWIAILVLFTVGVAPAMAEMFPDTTSRSQFASAFNNPIMVAMMGPIYGADNYTSGAMYGGLMLVWYAIAVAVMNIFFVVRHTRADEQAGRVEVVRSLPTGRLANLNATMISALILNLILGLFTGLGLAVLGIETMDFAGSMVYGAATAAIGMVFASIAAVFSQLSSNAGGATGMSFASIGVFYMIRAAGDMQGIEIVSCISPLGLVLRSQAYVENNIWPSLVLFLIALALSLLAYKLNSIRDLGQGFIAAKPGRAAASPLLHSSFGLAWRLLRTPLIVWSIVMLSLGASYASVVGQIDAFIGDSPEYMTILGVPVDVLPTLSQADQSKMIVESFGIFVTLMMTLVAIVPLLNAVLKIRSEEREGRTENVVSRAVPRCKYMAGYVILAFIASVVIQFLTAIGLYGTAAYMVGDANPFNFNELMLSFFTFLPALWIMIGFAVFIVGVFPKATGVIWGYFGLVTFTSFIGRLVFTGNLEWIMNLTPLHFVSQPEPLKDYVVNYPPLFIMTGIAAVLTIIGFIAYRKRDMVW
ncbi:MAG: hypothetical protein FWD38_04280 [Oscillospiraceae bacterium]|nr:hypothetical protein [Oscillospiraceae bacterium]